MSTRVITTEIWNDQKWRKEIKDLKTRYLWFYLLTSEMSQSCGVFYIPIERIAYDTLMTETEVCEKIGELEKHGLCIYSKETEEIAIPNMPKYNIRNMGKPMYDLLNRELSNIKDKSLIKSVYKVLLCCRDKTSDQKKYDLLNAILEMFSQKCGEKITKTEQKKIVDSIGDSEINDILCSIENLKGNV